MKKGTYYFTKPDHIYGLMRKTLIYVVDLKKKIFTYKIAEWNSDGNENITITMHYAGIRHGKLIDTEFFQEKTVIDNIFSNL